jgi:hypothetical protein
MNASAFENLWIVANIPSVILDALGSRGWLSERTLGELRLTRAGRALTDSAPVASAMSFRELIEAEPQLSTTGRYTFVHLLIPHAPYVLRSDCDYLEWDRSEDPLAQTECTLHLLDELFEAIEALGRFEDAFIVVHGDHGAPFRIQHGELVRARARSSRTPLMFKPPGRRRDVDLAICNVETTLLDVAPTVLDVTGLPLHPGFEGFSRRPAIASCTTL